MEDLLSFQLLRGRDGDLGERLDRFPMRVATDVPPKSGNRES